MASGPVTGEVTIGAEEGVRRRDPVFPFRLPDSQYRSKVDHDLVLAAPGHRQRPLPGGQRGRRRYFNLHREISHRFDLGGIQSSVIATTHRHGALPCSGRVAQRSSVAVKNIFCYIL